MLCNNCTKLALINSKRICLRCKSMIYFNLPVVCDNCSKTENLCAICLKRLNSITTKQRPKSGCSGCGN